MEGNQIKRFFFKTTMYTAVWCFIYMAVGIVWWYGEMWLYGEPRPCAIDTVIGIVLASSLFKNLNFSVKYNGL